MKCHLQIICSACSRSGNVYSLLSNLYYFPEDWWKWQLILLYCQFFFAESIINFLFTKLDHAQQRRIDNRELFLSWKSILDDNWKLVCVSLLQVSTMVKCYLIETTKNIFLVAIQISTRKFIEHPTKKNNYLWKSRWRNNSSLWNIGLYRILEE